MIILPTIGERSMQVPYALPRTKPYTHEQVKALFKKAGIPIAQWAKKNNFPVNRVYLLTNGLIKGNYGVSHDIAIKLGLKIPEIQVA